MTMIEGYEGGFIPQGWQCPVCHSVYAPTWPFCTACGSQEVVTTTNVTTNVNKPIDELVKEWREILKKAEVGPWYINSMLGEPYGVDKEDEDGLDKPESGD